MAKKKKAVIKNIRPVNNWKINVIAISVPLLIGLIWTGFNLPVDNVMGVDCVHSPYETRMSIILGEKQQFDTLKKDLLRQQSDKARKNTEWRRDHPRIGGGIIDSFCTPGPRYTLYVL